MKKTEEEMKINRSRGQQLSTHYIRRLREGMTFQSPMVFLQPSSYAYSNAQDVRGVIMHQCKVCEQRTVILYVWLRLHSTYVSDHFAGLPQSSSQRHNTSQENHAASLVHRSEWDGHEIEKSADTERDLSDGGSGCEGSKATCSREG